MGYTGKQGEITYGNDSSRCDSLVHIPVPATGPALIIVGRRGLVINEFHFRERRLALRCLVRFIWILGIKSFDSTPCLSGREGRVYMVLGFLLGCLQFAMVFEWDSVLSRVE